MKLGYAGTKTEIQRLIKDASQMIDIQKELGVTVDASSLSFDNVVNAISVMQKKLGITGTTAKEATTTIQGSTAMMKAAWDNLVVGWGDKNADVSKLTEQFVETIVGGTDEAGKHINGFIDNVYPVVSNVLEQLPKVIDAAGQVLINKLPELSKALLPALMQSVTTLILEFARSLPSLLPALLDALKQAVTIIGQQLPEIIKAVIEFVETDMPVIIETITEIILQIVDLLTQPEIISRLVEAGVKMFVSLHEGFLKAMPQIIAALPSIIEDLAKALLGSIPTMIQAGIKLFTSLVSNLPAIIAGIIQAIPQIMTAIWDALNPFGPEMSKIFSSAWEGIKQIFNVDTVGMFFKGVWDGITNAFSHVGEWFLKTFSDAWNGIKDIFSATGETFGNIGRSILNGLSTVINGVISGINNVIRLPIDGLNTILRIIHDIDIFGLRPFDWIGQIPVPQIPPIPMLAEGGVLKRGQIALLEGQGDEAVIPLSQNTEWIDGVADRLSSKLGNESATYNFTINIANMNADDETEIEQLAERLMEVMSEKTARRRNAF